MSSQFRDPAAAARWVKRRQETAPGTGKSIRRGHDTWPPPIRDPREEEPPHAEVEKSSWCGWSIRILHGWMQWGPDGMPFTHIGTRRSAEARARRLLARYTRKYERERQAKIDKRRIELVSPEEFHRGVEHRRETAQALADLRDPDGAWEREFAALEAPRRRQWWQR
ncbi:hypothetical protein QC999_gp54 [Microbacterium phage Cressida]|uniref:Uncharacterized protein n=1 Tax=Microbacterium phage Cressida TaxID=2591216 RepID=A0A514DI48_9CAUD|nr:hypothetical protein QC999_gp54 [Microbacterium phage Cressida]QDH93296.1 hypothetical protein PBI_CRESSIDA_54 [Microbacterium phage Cressida]